MGILKRLEIDYSYDIVEEFLSHYALMCDLLEPLIINLGRADKYKDSILELTRIFHNIKSAAGFMHLDPILKLTTLAEEITQEARSLKGPANDKFIDWLLLKMTSRTILNILVFLSQKSLMCLQNLTK